MSEIPARIGRYDVLSLLGQGGMGLLYLARDPVIDRHVALKLLKVDNDDLRRRFVREARSAGRLQHPNIVTVYDVDEHDGELFIAMEYIEGSTLSALIRNREPMPMLRKLELLDQLADGLGYAHGRGIIHRDIKPANLMVSRGGLLKILDFGIARIVTPDAVASVAGGALLGTPAYMAPEQLTGADVDHRADIYAVGLVMYELISGERAFTGPTAEVLERVLTTEPTPLEVLVPSADAEIVRCVRRAIAKRPEERYQDLQSLRADLARIRRKGELESGAFDATVVVSTPDVTSLKDGTAASTGRRDDDTPTQPDPGAAAADETIVAPVASGEFQEGESASRGDAPPPIPPPLPLAAAQPQAGASEDVARSGAAPQPARRSMLPALVVLGIVVIMLAAGTLAAVWWVRSRLFDRPSTVATTSPSPTALPPSEAASDVPADPPVPPSVVVEDDAPDPEPGEAVGDDPPANDGPAREPAQPAREPRAGTLTRGEGPSSGGNGPQPVAQEPVTPPEPAPREPQRQATDPRDEALSLVRAFVAARNTEHAAGMRRVWPGADDADIRRMTSGSSAPLTLSGCDVVSEAEARLRADCHFTQPGTTGFSEGTPLTIRRRLVFVMEHQDTGWVITDVRG